jgi:hypothetical protein
VLQCVTGPARAVRVMVQTCATHVRRATHSRIMCVWVCTHIADVIVFQIL